MLLLKSRPVKAASTGKHRNEKEIGNQACVRKMDAALALSIIIQRVIAKNCNGHPPERIEPLFHAGMKGVVGQLVHVRYGKEED